MFSKSFGSSLNSKLDSLVFAVSESTLSLRYTDSKGYIDKPISFLVLFVFIISTFWVVIFFVLLGWSTLQTGSIVLPCLSVTFSSSRDKSSTELLNAYSKLIAIGLTFVILRILDFGTPICRSPKWISFKPEHKVTFCWSSFQILDELELLSWISWAFDYHWQYRLLL